MGTQGERADRRAPVVECSGSMPTANAQEGEAVEAGRFGPRGGIIWVLLAVVVIPLLLGYALLRAVDVGARAQVVPQSPVENAAASIRVEGPRQAEAAVLAFTPSGAQENIQQAILNATGHPGRLGRGGLPGTASARPSGHGRWQVVFRVPVDLSVLEAEGAIGFGSLPGA
jgi:hypothetical protein